MPTYPPEIETAAAATGTALARLEEAVIATSTALARNDAGGSGSLTSPPWLLLVAAFALVTLIGAVVVGGVLLVRARRGRART
ncbi:MAG TPA: hypothetical protein VLD63_05415 [Anaerolineales bacterium]|nr:hypothetical protein [Anaerolineales bacterium]